MDTSSSSPSSSPVPQSAPSPSRRLPPPTPTDWVARVRRVVNRLPQESKRSLTPPLMLEEVTRWAIKHARKLGYTDEYMEFRASTAPKGEYYFNGAKYNTLPGKELRKQEGIGEGILVVK